MMKCLNKKLVSNLLTDLSKRAKLLLHPNFNRQLINSSSAHILASKSAVVKTPKEHIQEMAPERRRGDRILSPANIMLKEDGRNIPVIESSFRGARVVLSDAHLPGDRIEMIIQNPARVLEAEARVVWISTLSTGKVVAGLEF